MILFLSFAQLHAQQKSKAELLSPVKFEAKMKAVKGQVIDVRTPKEFNAGHLDGAINMHVYDKDFSQRLDKLDKRKPIYVYCKVGARSAEAAEVMKGKGFTSIIELEGGMDAWTAAGKPVKK